MVYDDAIYDDAIFDDDFYDGAPLGNLTTINSTIPGDSDRITIDSTIPE